MLCYVDTGQKLDNLKMEQNSTGTTCALRVLYRDFGQRHLDANFGT